MTNRVEHVHVLPRLATLLFVLSTLSGCIGLPGAKAPPPEHVGPHPVGVTTIHAHDAGRDRDLEVEVWYPAAPGPTKGRAEIYRVKGTGGTVVARLRSAVGAHRNAAPLVEKHPVIVLSHGATSSRLAHVSLSEVLASHGYVVAAPDHVGHTMADKLPGVSWDQRARAAIDRPLDLSLVLDELIARSKDRRSIFEGMIDVDRVAVAGHSFGGRTALGFMGAEFNAPRQAEECRHDHDHADRRCNALPVFGDEPYRYRDPRVKAALLIAPSGFKFYRADGVAKIDTPTLVVGAHRDHTTPFDQFHGPIFRSLHGPHYLLDLQNAGHLTATDVCSVVDSVGFFADLFGGEEARDGCGPDYMSPRVALEAVTDVALPFLDYHLNRREEARLVLQAALARNNAIGARVAKRRDANAL